MPGDASIPSVTATNQYNRSALVSSSWSTAGVLQTYTYDNLGHLLSLSKSEADGDRAITKYFRYDPNGNLIYGTDGNGNVTEYTYDAMNRVIFVSQGGKTTGTTYDANGNQLTATDWLGNTQTNVYDGLNRLVEKRDATDLPQETYFYDESSRQIAAEDVYGRRTTYEYDRNNRLIRTTAPDGYTVAQTYDRRGNVVTQTDALGNTTHYAYDYLGRLVSVTDALDQTTTYTYDLKGNLLSQTDSAGNTTYLEYNSRDRVIRKVSPGGRTGTPGAYTYDPTAVISYTYDALGNTLTRTDRNGNTTVFEWDVHGNLLSQAIGSNEILYTYDNNGNVLTMTDSIGTITRVYDEFNRCIGKTVPIIGTSVYVYDLTAGLPAGNVAETTTDPKGNTTLREYDRTGRLVRVTDTAVDLTTHTVIYTYNDNGSVASVLYPDGAREDYTYTDGNLLETLTNTLSDSTVLETYVYTYDLARNLLTKQDAKGTTAYTYDPLGRVLTVTEPSGKLTEYAFDAAGNRSTQTVTETDEDETVTVVRTTYTYDVRNRLIQLQKHDISDALLDPILLDVTDYTYDHSGNQLLTTRTTYTDGVAGTPVMLQSNTYDVWNQLVRTETENGTVVENAYNGDGQRIIKTVNGAATYYLYEYDKVILETNVFGDVTGRNVYGLNLLIRTVGVDTFYYMYNGHADVTALLTPEGTVAASYYYDAFGNILEQTGEVSNSVLFAGYQYDKETGLYYLNARMYDPMTARFMQEDTFAGQPSDPLSLNLYTYCHNSPLMYSDPTGHSDEELQLNGEGDSSYFQGGGGMPSWAIHATQNYLKAKDLCSKLPNETSRKALMKMYDESVDSSKYYSSSENAISDFSRTLVAIDGVTQHSRFDEYYGIIRNDTIASNLAEDKNRLSLSAIEWDTIEKMVDDYKNLRFGVYSVDPVTVSDGTNTYSGGNQSWFSPDNPRYQMNSTQLSEYGSFIATTNKEGGCGIVCATDIMALLAQQSGGASLFSSVSSNYSVDEYFQNMETMSNYVVPIRTYLDFTISTPFGSVNFEYYPQGIKINIPIFNINAEYNGTVGVWPQSYLTNGMVDYAEERGVDLDVKTTTYGCSDFNSKDLQEEIVDALECGSPVALNFVNKNKMYHNTSKSTFDESKTHWVTIVGIEVDSVIGDSALVKVLSWGRPYYIDLDEFVNNASVPFVEGISTFKIDQTSLFDRMPSS